MKNENSLKKLVSILLAAVLLCSSSAAVAYSAATDDNIAQSAQKATANTEKNQNKAATSSQAQIDKDETVYVLSGADGSVNKVIVSDWIKNNGSKSIEDISDLKNIKNVKGNETYEMDEKNACVWDAQGNDIYYQGDSDKELPVSLTVTYQLDNKQVSAEQLAGKSGRVKIRFDYKNNQFENVKIDGKSEKIAVPFVMMSGMMLDNDKFSNIEVSNGKLINTGEQSIAIGVALPGLSDNLGISADEADIPDYVEISADVTDFELSTTMTLATNDVFNNLDLDKASDIDDLVSNMATLESSSQQLIDGSSQLYTGLTTLLEKSDALISGVKELSSYSKKIASSAKELNDGAQQINNYTSSLDTGLKSIVSYNSSINSGATQVFDTLLSTVSQELSAAGISAPTLTKENYGAVLSGVLSSLSDESASSAQAMSLIQNAIKNAVESAATSEELQAILSQTTMTEDVYNTLSDEEKALVDKLFAQGWTPDSVSQQIVALLTQKLQDPDIYKDFSVVMGGMTETIKQMVQSAKEQLDSYNEFYQGVLTYTAMVDKASSSTSLISQGTLKLSDGTSKLSDGTNTFSQKMDILSSSSNALVNGVQKLSDGSMQLNKGLVTFDKEGIQKLVSLVDGDVSTLITRLRATVDVSKDYLSYSGISSDMTGNVKFIYKTDEIKK